MVGENSLSGGERSIRIFSLAAASSSASPFPPLLGGEPLIKKGESRFEATGASPERPPQSASELESYLGFLYTCKKKSGWMKFQEILLAGVRLWKVVEVGDGLPRGQWPTAAGIIGKKNSLTQWIALRSSGLRRRIGRFIGETNHRCFYFILLLLCYFKPPATKSFAV